MQTLNANHKILWIRTYRRKHFLHRFGPVLTVRKRFGIEFRSAAQSPHPLVGCRTRFRPQSWAPPRRFGGPRVSVDITTKREAQRTLLKPCSAGPPCDPALLQLLRSKPTAGTLQPALSFSTERLMWYLQRSRQWSGPRCLYFDSQTVISTS